MDDVYTLFDLLVALLAPSGDYRGGNCPDAERKRPREGHKLGTVEGGTSQDRIKGTEQGALTLPSGDPEGPAISQSNDISMSPSSNPPLHFRSASSRHHIGVDDGHHIIIIRKDHGPCARARESHGQCRGCFGLQHGRGLTGSLPICRAPDGWVGESGLAGDRQDRWCPTSWIFLLSSRSRSRFSNPSLLACASRSVSSFAFLRFFSRPSAPFFAFLRALCVSHEHLRTLPLGEGAVCE